MNTLESNSKLKCPVCNKTLFNNDKTQLRCDNNHSFDKAKQGYVNLLLANGKKSHNPGDSKEMVISREQFLEQGFYDPIYIYIINKIKSLFINEQNLSMLDLGTGTGYYLHNIINGINKVYSNIDAFGLDISKEAIKLASKKDKSIKWVVSSNFNPPFLDNSFDLLMSIFSPLDYNVCNKILNEKGYLIRVLPLEDHLIELRKIIYDNLFERNNNMISEEISGFESKEFEKVNFKITLNNSELNSLLKMTPHYWKSSNQKQLELENIQELTVTIDLVVQIHKKV